MLSMAILAVMVVVMVMHKSGIRQALSCIAIGLLTCILIGALVSDEPAILDSMGVVTILVLLIFMCLGVYYSFKHAFG